MRASFRLVPKQVPLLTFTVITVIISGVGSGHGCPRMSTDVLQPMQTSY